jgi:uracil permease
MDNKKSLIYSLIAVLLITMIVAGGTFAYFQWTSGEGDRSNVNVTIEAGQITMHIEPEETVYTNLRPTNDCNNAIAYGDALATIVAGFLGGPANTTYGENTAVLAITKNYDPSILRRTAIFAMLLACVSIFGGFLQSIPTEVMGGISIMLFSMISYVGLKTINDSKCVTNKKNLIIIATIMIIGLGTTYLSNKGIVIGIPVTESVSITGLSLAAIVGIVLNILLNNTNTDPKEDKKLVNPKVTTA